MIAYKFLARGAISPFTGFQWPTPDAGAVAWVSASPGAAPDRWVHACRVRDLPYWLDEELWEVELAAPASETQYQIRAPRARLLAPVAGWSIGIIRAYAEACAWRARDIAVAGLAAAGLAKQAHALRACAALGILQARAVEMSGAEQLGIESLAGYVADAAASGVAGDAGAASYITAAAAAALVGSPAGFTAERERQAGWLSEHLALS